VVWGLGFFAVISFITLTFELCTESDMNIFEAIMASGYTAHCIYKKNGEFTFDVFKHEIKRRYDVDL